MKEKQMVPREPGRGTLLNCGWHGEGGPLEISQEKYNVD